MHSFRKSIPRTPCRFAKSAIMEKKFNTTWKRVIPPSSAGKFSKQHKDCRNPESRPQVAKTAQFCLVYCAVPTAGAPSADNCCVELCTGCAVCRACCLMVDKLASHRQDLRGTLIHQLEMMQNRGGENQEKIRQIDKQIADLSAQNLVVARLHTNGVLNATNFATQSSVISNKINALRLDRKKALAEDEDDELIYTLKSLDDTLAGYVPGAAFNQALFEEIVQSITVVDNARLTFHLVGGLTLTEQIPENARCRTA